MPQIVTIRSEQETAKVYGSEKSEKAKQYDEFMNQLAPGKSIILKLEEGETVRSVRIQLNRAAKERDWKLIFKETQDGTLDSKVISAAEVTKRTRRKKDQ